MKTRPDQGIRALRAGLEARREEIGEAVLARVTAIDGAARDGDPEYTHGLHQAIEAAIDHSLEAATEGDDERAPIPAPLLAQARLAARHRVPLETVLRRYLAGHALIGDFVAEEAALGEISPEVLRGALRDQASRTDRIVAAISATYGAEASAVRPRSSARRRAELVRRLLDGELIDPSGLAYEFDACHVGLVVRGAGGSAAVEAISKRFDARRLAVEVDEDTNWLWLGFKSNPDPQQLREAVPLDLPELLRVGIGEPAGDRSGWRLTHEQARAALSVAVRQSEPVLRYRDVALLATAMQDELLTNSLAQMYLKPLEEDRQNGRRLQATYRAYFSSNQSVASTAAALGVSRNTVRNRIRTIEQRVGYLDALRGADLFLALRLEELMRQTAQP